MSFDVRWKMCWESELELSDHKELTEFFRTVYAPTGSFNAKPFERHRSWAGARPELRAIAYDSRGIAAHMGALRRFIKVGDTDQLVAELGLYGVRQDLERLGLSYSISAMYPTLQQLGVPFAFGTVRHAMRSHMERWSRGGLATIKSGVRVRSTLPDVFADLSPTRLDDALVVIVPVTRQIDEWPSGTLIDRNGPEL
ncbi:NodA family N-acyltransferase [Mesorhizobium sp. BHbsci]